MKKIIFPIILVFISGCTNSAEVSSSIKDKKTATENQPTISSTKTSISSADQLVIEGAVLLGDPEYCNKLENKDLKEGCLNELSVSIDNSKLRNLDCDEISSPDLKKTCLINKDINEKLLEKKAIDNSKLEKEYALRDEAYSSSDLNKCEQIEQEGVRSECRLNIIAKKASDTKNPELCKTLDSAELSEICFEIAKVNQ